MCCWKSIFWRINKVVNFKLDISFYVIKRGEEEEVANARGSLRTKEELPGWYTLLW